MIRRSFRIGLRLGVLIGVVFAVAKTVQARRDAAAEAPPPPWDPLLEKPRPPTIDLREPVENLVQPASPAPAPAPAARPEPDLDVVPAPQPVEITPPVPPAATSTPAKKAPAATQEPVAKKAAAAKKAPAKKVAKKAAPPAPFVEPIEGVCPTSHPVKAKLSSRLFHLPGMFAYDRTRPDRCYLDGAAAVADGFTSAKR